MYKAAFFIFLTVSILFLNGCDSDDIPTENYVRLNINGTAWEAFQIIAQTSTTSTGELRINITATSDLNETVFIIIQGFEDELSGRTQEITSSANGDALGYRLPGTGTGPETHSSFTCTSVGGRIFVLEYNEEESYITGDFSGTVCDQGGLNRITFSEGEFVRVELD